MSRYLRPILWSLGVAALAGALAWLLVVSPHVRYRHLRVVGAQRAEAAHLRHLADLPLGEPLVMLDLDRAAAGAERHPWVASVEVRRSFPDTVVLQVREREPVAILHVDGLYLVDESGEPFVRAQPGDLDHPYLTGLSPVLAAEQPEVARRVVREGLAWLAVLQDKGGLPESAISELHFSEQSGYTVILRNGGEVLLGFADRERASRLVQLARNGLDLSRPQRVDLASDRLAVVTPL
ncbi:MAG: FtsQ-type POTRA domain-containing protein [Deltaproteobacteria bacterium]|nr:FtsQ-type POTRA domain-containing protein [Deltaproteobacteria bacterium]